MSRDEDPSEEAPTRAEHYRKVLGLLAELHRMLHPRTRTADRRRHGRWGAHVPQLALTAADMIEADPDSFAGLPFSAQELRDLADEVRWLLQVKAQIDDLHKNQLVDSLLSAKDALYDKTYLVVNMLRARRDDPLLQGDAANRTRMARVANPILSILDQRSAAKLSKQRANASLRDSQAAKLANAEAALQQTRDQISILRGAPLPSVPARLKRRDAR